MRLQYDIELVDIEPYKAAHPSPYWSLLAINLIGKGFGQWVPMEGELRPFLPKTAVEAFLNSEWITAPPPFLRRGRASQTYLMVDERDGLIKIGRADNPVYREGTLQGKAPQIKLLAVCPENIEAALHKQYAHYRVRGEWFRLEASQVDLIIQENGFTKTSE